MQTESWIGEVYPAGIAAWTSEEKAAQAEAGRRMAAELKQAAVEGKREFRIPPGNYRFEGGTGILLENIADFTVTGDGAAFWFTSDVRHAIVFRNCRNLRFRGVTLDMDGMPFLQGTVQSVDLNGKFLIVELEEYYMERFREEASHDLFRVMFLTRDGGRETDSLDFLPARGEMEPIGGNRLRVAVHADVAEHWNYQLCPPQAGDRIVFGMRRPGGMLYVDGCGGMEFDRVTIFASAGFAFYEAGFGEGGNRYRNCRLIRRPGTGRLLASAADCFHSRNQRRGPLIENCEFSWAMDDFVNIHGYFNVVLECTEPDELLIATSFGTHLETGTELTFFSAPHGNETCRAAVREFEAFPGTDAEGEKRIKQIYREKFGIALHSLPGSFLCRVKLDRPVRLSPGDFANSYDFCGRGAVLRNNFLHDGHVRGILLKSIDCRIENNRIERVALNGISLKPEFFWLEGPMPRRIRIAGNHLTDCGFNYSGVAAILAMSGCCLPPRDRFTAAVNAGEISVTGNVIENCNAGPGILIANCRTPLVRDNRIIHPFSNGNALGQINFAEKLDYCSRFVPREDRKTLETPRYPIQFLASEEIECEENTIIDPEQRCLGPQLIGVWCDAERMILQ